MSESVSCVQPKNKWVQMLEQWEREFTWLNLTVNLTVNFYLGR